MADEAAFFRFDTNIDDVQARIVAGLERIAVAARDGEELDLLGRGRLVQDASNLRNVFDTLETDLQRRRADLNRLTGELAAGVLDPKQFKQQYENLVRQSLEGIPGLLGRSLSTVSDLTFQGLDVPTLARQVATDYVTTLRAELDKQRPDLPLARVPIKRNFERELNDVTFGGLNFDEVNRRQQLAATLKAERLIEEATRDNDPYGFEQRTRAYEESYGLRGLTERLRAEAIEEGRLGFKEGRGEESPDVPFFDPSDAKDRLRELQRFEAESHQIAKHLKAAEYSADQIAHALRLVEAGDLRTFASLYLDPEGGFLRRTATGADVVTNPLDVARANAAIDEHNKKLDEAAEKQRQLDIEREAGARIGQAIAFEDARKVGGAYLDPLTGQPFKRTTEGAVPVQNPIELAEINRLEEQRREELAQYNREIQRHNDLLLRSGEVRKVAGFHVLGDEVFKIKEGRAILEEDALLRADVLAARDAQIQKEIEQEEKRAAAQQKAIERTAKLNHEERKFFEQVIQHETLTSRLDDVRKVAGHHVLDDTVYKVSDGQAREVRDEVIRRDVLEARDAQIRREEERAAREAEAARRRREREQRAQAGFTGGFFNRLSHNGATDLATGIGGQIGAATSFAFAYGALFGLQNAIRDTINEFKDYQDSLTDLEVATKRSDLVTNDYVNTLSELAILSGSNVGAALDTAARATRAFSDGTESRDQLQDIGATAAEAATKLSLIADKPLQDATGDIIAIASAYGLGAEELNRVVDAVSNAKRELGGDPAQIAQGLSLIAGSAQEAGFSLTEAANIISLVQARTDQSGQAIATRLTRIFQITTGSTGKRLAAELGVDPNLSPRDQFQQYAQLYADPETSESVKDRITSALGGTANLRELLPLLEENTRLQEAYRAALESSGAGNDEFNRKSENLVGTLKKIAGAIKSLQVNLSESGLFAGLGLAAEVIEPTLHAVDRLVRLYNELPATLRQINGLLLNTLLISKAIGVVQSANGGAFLASLRRGGGLADDAAAAAIASGNPLKTGTARSGLAALGRGLVSGPGVAIGGAFAGLAVFQQLSDARDQVRRFDAALARSVDTLAQVDGSGASLREAAEALSAASGSVSTDESNVATEARQKEVSEFLKEQSAAVSRLADAVGKEEAAAAAKLSGDTFPGQGVIETAGDLAIGLQNLDAAGAGATTRIRLLAEVLGSAIPKEGLPRFAPEAFSADLSASINDAIGQAAAGGVRAFVDKEVFIPGTSNFDVTGKGSGTATKTVVEDISSSEAIRRLQLSGEEITALNEAILAKAAEMGLKAGSPISDAQIEKLARFAASQLALGDVIAEDVGRFRRDVVEALADTQIDSTQKIVDFYDEGGTISKARRRALNGRGRLDAAQIASILNPSEDGSFAGLINEYTSALQNIPAGSSPKVGRDISARIARLLRRLSKRGGSSVEQFVDFQRQVEHDLAAAQIDILERQRSVAQSAPGLSKKERKQIGRDFFQREIQAAGENVDLLIQILEGASREELRLAREALRRVAEARAAAARLLARTRNALLGELGKGVGGGMGRPGVGVGDGPAPKTPAEIALDEAASLVPPTSAEDSIYSGTAATSDPAKKDEAAAAEESKESVRAARAAARAARLGGGIASARAAIVAAREQLNDAKKGTAEYYNALAGYFEAQRSLRDAIVAYRTTRFRLVGDITDPVENARDELRGAVAQLRADRGSGKDVIAEDRLAVREARQALLSEKFQQRFNDAQTAEQLGRISFQAYVRYLENEHDRLEKIKNRTRQQQEQLDQVDAALQEAAGSADSQFNLGDINTNGLVYQVRRFQAEQRAFAAAASSSANSARASTQTVSIQINGTDIGKVKQVLREVLGTPPSGPRRTVRHRKV